jgi:ribosomal protein S3
MPYQGIAHDIGYSYRIAVTKFGVFGIKLWLLKYLSDDLKLPKFILNDASQWIKALKARKTARIQRGILRKWKIMKKRLLKKRGYSRKKQKKQKIW